MIGASIDGKYHLHAQTPVREACDCYKVQIVVNDANGKEREVVACEIQSWTKASTLDGKPITELGRLIKCDEFGGDCRKCVLATPYYEGA